MKKVLSFMLVSVMLLTQLALPTFALDYADNEWDDPYEGLAVESVSVEVNKTLIENVDGGIYGIEYEDGTVEEQFYYDTYYAEPTFTVVYENGDTEIGDEYTLYGDLWLYDTQDEEPWEDLNETLNEEEIDTSNIDEVIENQVDENYI